MLSFFVDFSNSFCAIFFPIAFRLSQLTPITGREFKSMNSGDIVYPYLSTPIGKTFLVSTFLFCFVSSHLSLGVTISLLYVVTTITVLRSVSCDHKISFNYDGKKARDVGLTCWCHLSNIMPDSIIFHESMRQGIIVFLCCCFLAGWYFCFLQGESDGISFITLICLVSFWLTIKLYHYCYGLLFTSYYSILYY